MLIKSYLSHQGPEDVKAKGQLFSRVIIFQGNPFSIPDTAHCPWQRTDNRTVPAQTPGNSHCAKVHNLYIIII